MKKFSLKFSLGFSLGLVLFLGFSSKGITQVDLYPFPKVDEIKPKKQKEQKPVEPFVQALAKKFQISERTLSEFIAKGFGRSELIRLILISKKSGASLDDLTQEREKGTRLAKMAEDRKLNNKEIVGESKKILKELLEEETKIKEESKKQPPPTPAGTSDSLTKDTTAPVESSQKIKKAN